MVLTMYFLVIHTSHYYVLQDNYGLACLDDILEEVLPGNKDASGGVDKLIKEVLPNNTDWISDKVKEVCQHAPNLRKDVEYRIYVQGKKLLFHLNVDNMFAIPDQIGSKFFCLVKAIKFVSPLQNDEDILYACNCAYSYQQKDRLMGINNVVSSEPLMDFVAREESQYCVHAAACKVLSPHDTVILDEDEESEMVSVEQLRLKPLLVAVYDTDYGIVGIDKYNKKNRFVCFSCDTKRVIRHCTHVNTYRSWCADNDIHIDFNNDDQKGCEEFKCASHVPIPLRLPEELGRQHQKLSRGVVSYPTEMVPQLLDTTCTHGNNWSTDDPISNGWVACEQAVIYKNNCTIGLDPDDTPIKVYYIPTDGTPCKCKLHYDGQEHLLFNLNDRELFSYDLLLDYMCAMVNGKNPIAAYYRQYDTRVQNLTACNEQAASYQSLRRAWNAYARLLDIDYNEAYKCEVCQDSPRIIICDATFIGFRKDLLENMLNTSPTVYSTAQRSHHKDRVFISVPQIREKLEKLSGIKIKKGVRGRARQMTTDGLPGQEYRKLLRDLRKDPEPNMPTLADFLESVCPVKKRKEYVLPKPHAQFIFELSRNGPVCGLVQIAGDKRAMDLLIAIYRDTEGNYDITDSTNSKDLTYLQETAPVLTQWMTLVHAQGQWDQNCRELLRLIVRNIAVSVSNLPDTHNDLEPEAPNKLCCYPNLPKLRASLRYAADVGRSKNDPKETNCRKESYGHPTLSPGIFTIFCPHGICYGFEAMDSHESPRHPFNIFRTRFKVAPDIIVYDNACQLHTYCLNRDPVFFKFVKFLIDRFHWKGHCGCSKGYCMDSYSANPAVSSTNSQTNEQMNSLLGRMAPQLSYMSPENFMFHVKLFFACHNDKKNCRLRENPEELIPGMADLLL